jgi:predicted ferric reductase
MCTIKYQEKCIMPLDLMGNISLSLQVVILFLLILGIPFVKGAGVKKNFILHGYLTILALVLHTILIFLVMIPSFSQGFGDISTLPLLSVVNIWSHVILGTAAEIIGFVIVGFWLSKPLANMGCIKTRKVMTPLFIIWTISVMNGTLIHILQML